MLLRKGELCEAASLPHMEKKDRDGILGSLKWEFYELDNESTITKMERLAEEKRAKGLHRPKKKRKTGVKNG